MTDIIEAICGSCGCNEQTAKEYLHDEVNYLRELADANDLRVCDIDTACSNLGLDQDYDIYFLQAIGG